MQLLTKHNETIVERKENVNMAESGFRCEYCGQFFTSKRKCELHEEREGVKELKIKYPGSVECPKCNARGTVLKAYGDGFTFIRCPKCNGKKVVYPIKREVTEYNPI